MKKILLLAGIAVAMASCSNPNAYTIDGQIAGATGMAYLLDNEMQVVDSTALSAEGAFHFEGVVEEPAVAFVRDGRERATSFSAMLILEPGAIQIADDAEQSYRKVVSGTPANDASRAYAEASGALVKEFRAEETTEERRTAIEEEYEALSKSTLEANRNNLFGAMMLAQELAMEMSAQEILDEIARFSPALQATSVLTKLKAHAEQVMLTEVGKPYINIELPTAEGEIISLQSVIENPQVKYTLIDFWASWCGPCMGEVPHLKEAYKKFHKKGFEIYGISLDKSQEKWWEAVKEHKMEWIHVGEVNGWENKAVKDYAVRSIPTNLLVNSDGVIIAKNLRGEEVIAKLEEVL